MAGGNLPHNENQQVDAHKRPVPSILIAISILTAWEIFMGGAMHRFLQQEEKPFYPQQQFNPPRHRKMLTLQDLNCSDHQHGASIMCPQGKNTSESYAQNMLYWYGDTNRDYFIRCANLSLPLQRSDPRDCWPRTIMLASHATSGNELFQDLLDSFIIGSDISMSQYRELPKRKDALFDVFRTENGHTDLRVWGTLNTSSAIPFMRRPVIFKSHMCQSSSTTQRNKESASLNSAKDDGTLTAIIRMARNPGDQILRNHFRWHNHACYNKGDECFHQQAKKYCRSLKSLSKTYVAFHSYWDEFDPEVPQMIIHNEHITSKDKIEEEVLGVIKFLDNLTPEIDYSKFFRTDQMKDVIKEPKYVHGTLVAEVCGKEVSRQVHDATKQYSEKLGYVFDDENATWSLNQTFAVAHRGTAGTTEIQAQPKHT